MKNKILLLTMIFSLVYSPHVLAKRSGFVLIKSFFKKPQNVNTAVYSEDIGTNTATLTLGGRRKFSSATIIIEFNNLLDQIVKGAKFTTASTGTIDSAGTISLNILAAKFKEDGGFEYTTFQDDESSVKDVTVEVLKVSKKTGAIKLRVKASFDNVRCATLDQDSNESSVERINDIKVFGKVKYDTSNN